MPKKDYAKKKYANPLREKSGSHRRLSHRSRGVIVTGVVVFTLSAISYGLLLGPWIKVKTVEVTGSDRSELVTQINLWVHQAGEVSVWGFIPGDNLFLLPTAKLRDQLLSDSHIGSVDIQKKLPDKLIININEKQPAFILNWANRQYIFDRQGKLISALSSEAEIASFNLPQVSATTTQAQLASNTPEIDARLAEFIYTLNLNYPKYTEDVLFQNYQIQSDNQTLKVFTTAGWYTLFDSKVNLNVQLSNLSRILHEIITTTEKNQLEYIDVRLVNYVYYK